MLKVDGWMRMVEEYGLVDDDFTLNQAVLCYVWSRMATIEEVRDFSRFESLTFIDFLEAIALVADMKHLPLASDLSAAGMNILQWAIAKAAGALFDPSSSDQANVPFVSITQYRPLLYPGRTLLLLVLGGHVETS
jgi:hypothetical protein